MASPKTLFFSLLCTIFVIIIYIGYKSKNKSSHRPSLPQTSRQTCLTSFDAEELRKSVFHLAMVHFRVPSTLAHWVQDKTGFEIGGPSVTTWGNLGAYEAAAKVDVTNFAANTLWESGLTDGSPFMWKTKPKGKQYIRDAVDLHGIPDESYDFVCSVDTLEHIANPFKALVEWLRILRPRGLLLIIVPFKNVTFDHKRDVARIEHLIDDYNKKITEADLSHLDDIFRLHDIARDLAAGSLESFKRRSEKNFQNRGLHQHVYDQELLYHIYTCLNLEVKTQFIWDYHNLIIGQKR